MEFICDYMRDAGLRRQLNELAEKTFWLSFEDWVNDGYYGGEYIPYSYTEGGRLLSNASVNIMTFEQNGERRNYIQIGTVMTDEEYRGRGLARSLMERIIAEYSGKCDGIYLFGNMTALGFYRKLGFSEMCECRYTLKNEYLPDGARRLVPAAGNAELCGKYRGMVRSGAVNSSLEQLNKFGLQMFYTADMESVYYDSELDCFAVMEEENGALTLQSVISDRHVQMKELTAHLGGGYSSIALGFSPLPRDEYLFDGEMYDGGDEHRLFYMGEKLKSIQEDRLCFPELSHA